MTKQYIVVENAGYEGERDVHWASTYMKASDWLNRQYDDEDKENCRPDICVEIDGERSYEI